MGYLQEYIEKNWTTEQFISELQNLVATYNTNYETFLVIYAADTDKDVPGQQLALGMRDYQVLSDMLGDSSAKKLDFYLETPGGSGEAAEEIVRFTRLKFKMVEFIVAGECKSAGTLMALSGDEISMTDTGSLGPIDAQMGIGRSQVSAHDYMKWIKAKQEEYKATEAVNPFDAIMIAQISPGELEGVNNALNYAHDLVVEWLPKYKFAKWRTTETAKIKVTQTMRVARAKEIAEHLSDHSNWRTHARSLKIQNLNDLKLKINRIDDDSDKAELVYRIKTVIRMIFLTSPIYKLYVTENARIFENAGPVIQTPAQMLVPGQGGVPDLTALNTDISCTNCGAVHAWYVKFIDDPNIDQSMQQMGRTPMPAEDSTTCNKCGNVIELLPIKNDIENQTGKKVLL